MSSPALKLASVNKQFGESVAVRDLNLEIAPGEFFAMLGPSGCGKTTTLKMMAGFEHPSSGIISLFGQDVSGLPPFQRDVNMMFQDYALFPHLDIRDNVAFGLRMKGVGRKERRARAEAMLERVHLPGIARRHIGEVSGGQQQRVALARALINDPKVLLLDEPLGALDLKLRKAMQLELKQIQRDVGISFVHVTHDQEEALAMADRIMIMRGGLHLQTGTPAEIYQRPVSRFVADFIGESSFLEGTVATVSGDEVSLALGSGEHVTARQTDQPFEVGDAAVAMVRPEDVSVVVSANGEATAGAAINRLPGTLVEIEYGGRDTAYFVRTRDGATVAARMRGSRPSELEVGASAEVVFAVQATQSLPPENGVQSAVDAQSVVNQER